MERLSVGVTGHRDIRPGALAGLRSQVRGFFESLGQQHPGQEIELFSALAEGADTIAAEAALELGIALVAVLPLPLEIYSREFGSPQAASLFEELLGKAERTVELPPKAGADLADQDVRSWHYARMGAWLSNHSQVLLALWDGKDNQALGGTAQVVRYHQGHAIPGVAEQPSRAQGKRVFQIVTGRDRPNGDPATGLEAGEERWLD